jgi:RNA polymerase sigma factor (sigma-70 family)
MSDEQLGRLYRAHFTPIPLADFSCHARAIGCNEYVRGPTGMTDQTLLTAFIERRDEQAFAELVRRYVDVVYSAARRQLRSEHLAEDVTQAVFILLARKARSIGGGKVLAGWLINSARLCARTAARREASLKAREQRAATMRSETVSSPDPLDAQDIRPKLDEALAALNASERTAVALRYLQGKPMKEVAATMDISEAAAAKRVARGTTRMRRFLSRRGVELAPAALTDAVCREMAITAPPAVASAAVDAGVSAANGGVVSGDASLIAADVAAAAALPLRWIAAAVLTLLFVGLLAIFVSNDRAPAQSAATAPASRPAKIRVGFYLSHLNATSQDPGTGKEFGYGMLLMRELNDSSFEVVPVIEPATESLGELPKVLATYFPRRKPLNAADVNDLRTLDAFIAGSANVPPEVLDAIEKAVNDGMGLMTRNLFGTSDPSFTPQMQRLYGLSQGGYGFQMQGLECEVIAEHPIISSRKGKPGQPVQMRANGAFGVHAPQSKGLIRIKDISRIRQWNPRNSAATLIEQGTPTVDGVAFYTVYTSQLGKGRIVCCCYATFDTPRNISESVGPEFVKRSIKWLAMRPVE